MRSASLPLLVSVSKAGVCSTAGSIGPFKGFSAFYAEQATHARILSGLCHKKKREEERFLKKNSTLKIFAAIIYRRLPAGLLSSDRGREGLEARNQHRSIWNHFLRSLLPCSSSRAS